MTRRLRSATKVNALRFLQIAPLNLLSPIVVKNGGLSSIVRTRRRQSAFHGTCFRRKVSILSQIWPQRQETFGFMLRIDCDSAQTEVNDRRNMRDAG